MARATIRTFPATTDTTPSSITGTHDNPDHPQLVRGLAGFLQQNVWKSLKRPAVGSGDVAPALIELAWGSAAALAIAPLQDVLNLGNEARMNRPGEAEGNWRWRCTAAMLTPAPWQWLRDLTLASNRALLVALNPGTA